MWDIVQNTLKMLTTMIKEAQKHIMAEHIVFFKDSEETGEFPKRK